MDERTKALKSDFMYRKTSYGANETGDTDNKNDITRSVTERTTKSQPSRCTLNRRKLPTGNLRVGVLLLKQVNSI